MSLKDLVLLEEKYELAINSLNRIEYHEAHPSYPKEISEFMNLLVEPPWVSHSYNPGSISTIFASIDAADISEIRCALTAANRSERFCEGAWKGILEQRQLDPVIKRIRLLLNA